ncbi:PAS domain S-box protein [Flectobacillus longus]|uniref:PAS domain S-box protein n=1 Tax=Flectobacillus longus TaxID=2984207 RepID=UPI0024B6A00B|nr:PAS domain S-box protein [Flectobacillus longus]MDI9879269.1 PAS domain S-box protein [Flectobacillus longus]
MLDIVKHISKPYLLFKVEQNNFVVTELNIAYLNYTGGLTEKQIYQQSFENLHLLFAQNEVYFDESLSSLKTVASTKATNTVYISLNNTEVEIQNSYFEENHAEYILHIITIADKSSIYLPELFETVVAHTTDTILIMETFKEGGPDPKILFVNKAFCDLSGYTLSEVLGNTPMVFIGLETDLEEINRLRTSLRNCQPVQLSLLHYKKSGEKFWLNISVSPIYDKSGRLLQWLSLGRDITIYKNEELRKSFKEKVRTLFRQPQTLNFILSELSLLITHELGVKNVEIWLNSFTHDMIRFGSQQNYIFPDAKAGADFAMKAFTSKEEIWETFELPDKKVIGIVMQTPKGLWGVLILGMPKNLVSEVELDWFKKLGELLINEIERKQVEEELKQIFDFAPDMICVLGLDGFFKRVNPAFCELLGYTEQELLSKKFHEFIYQEDQTPTLKAFKSEKDFSKVYSFENRYLTKSGDILNIAWRSTMRMDGKHLLAIGRDITEERKLQQLLRKTSLMSKIVSWEINLQSQNIFVSDTIHDVFGYSQDDFKLTTLNKLVEVYQEGEHRERAFFYIDRAIQTGQPWDGEFIIILPNGTERWARIIGETNFINGKCERLYGSIQDINHSKINELALQEVIIQKNEILETTGDTFIMLNQEWVVTYWNAQATKLTGISKEQIVGKVIWEVFAESIETEIFSNLEYSRKNMTPVTFESFYAPINRWVEIRSFPTEDIMSVYARDITEQKIAHQRIKEERNLLRTLIDNLPETVYFKDTKARKVISNRVDYLFLGAKSEQDVLGKTDLELFGNELGKIGYDHDLHILQTGESLFNYGQLHQTAGKPDLWLESTKVPVKNEKDEIIGVLGIGRDITIQKLQELELKKLNLELEEYIKQLEVSNTELEQFAYVASHDLQEPLRMITNFLSQIEYKYEAILDERGKQYIWYAIDGAKRMRQIILDLLDFSRVGRIEEKKQLVDVNEVLNHTLSVLHHEIIHNEAKILYGPMPVIFSSKLRIEQVFQNLISNALKYRRPDINPVIEIGVNETLTHWIFSVKDNGIGIEEEYFQTIFVIFQRLHTREEYPGTGIGLAIVKKIIEMLGGKVWVESLEHQGSTFYFSIKK